MDKTISLVSIGEALFCTWYVRIGKCCLFSLVRSHELCAHSSDIYEVHNRQHAQVPSFERCRPQAVRVRHIHVRSVAVAGCVGRSIPPSARFVFIQMYPGWYIPVHFVLLHRAQTTAQTTTATAHRACLPPASYITTTLLPSSSSIGHTLRVSMIVLRILMYVI